jgi:hypothetical protein
MKNTAKKLATTTAKKKPTNITEYIQTTPKDMQMKLRRMRDSIRYQARLKRSSNSSECGNNCKQFGVSLQYWLAERR